MVHPLGTAARFVSLVTGMGQKLAVKERKTASVN